MRTIAIALVVLLTGCGKDRGQCLKSHEQLVFTYMLTVGNISIPQYSMQTFCDEWEFPDGRPAKP